MASYIIEQLMAYFDQQVIQNKLAHAYLFTGNALESKRRLLTRIAQTYYCHNRQADGKGCGQCTVCQRIESNQFADILHIQPDGQTIKVDQVRQLKEWLIQSPIEGQGKFAVIEFAELLTPSAANALLTFLEEPTANVHIFLYSPEAALLLPTVLSRVQTFRVQAMSEAERAAALQAKGVLPQQSQVLCVLSDELMLRMVESYDASQVEQWLKRLNRWYQQLVQCDLMAFVTLQTQLKADITREQVIDCIDYWLLLTHQLLTHWEDKAFDFQASTLQALCEAHTLQRADLLQLYQLLLATKQRIRANVGAQLALEQCVIQYCKQK